MKRLCVWLRLAAMLWLLPGIALGRAPQALALDTRLTCPDPHAIQQELASLLPATEIRTAPTSEVPATNTARIEARKDALWVQIRDAERRFAPLPEDCGERARLVAIFITLVVEPPAVSAPDPEPPPIETASPAFVPEAAEPRAPWARIEAALTLHRPLSAERARRSPYPVGTTTRLSFGESYGVSIGLAGLLGAARFDYDTESVSLFRAGLDTAFRLQLVTPKMRWATDLGPEMTLIAVQGRDLEAARTSTRINFGARAATLLAFKWRDDLGWFLGASASFVPKAYALELEPGVPVGRTPHWWLGASLGLSIDVLRSP
jgi:hypothetical protein